MSAAELIESVQENTAASEDELIDEIYATVKSALDASAPRDELRAMLEEAYAFYKSSGQTKERRAVGEVLACFDGWCIPSVAL